MIATETVTSPRVLSIKHLRVKTKSILSKTKNSTVISFVKRKKNKALSLSMEHNTQLLDVFDNEMQRAHALTKAEHLVQAGC